MGEGKRSAHAFFFQSSRGARGFDRRSVTQPKKLQRSPRAARKRMRDSLSARSRRRAVKHGAVGGWMTARWSGVFRGKAVATPRFEEDLDAERRRGFSTALGG
jgi:hypothetical protein